MRSSHPAKRLGHIAAEQAQATRVGKRQQELGRPVRLGEARTGRADVLERFLVAIHHVCRWGRRRRKQQLQRRRRELVAGIDHCDERASCLVEPGIERRRAAVANGMHANAGIGRNGHV